LGFTSRIAPSVVVGKNRDTVGYFLDYLEICYKLLGDRVEKWIVMNEPLVFVGAGYFLGMHGSLEVRVSVTLFLPYTMSI